MWPTNARHRTLKQRHAEPTGAQPPKKSTDEKNSSEIEGIEPIEPEDIILDDELEEEANSSVDLEDNLLEEEDDDSTPIGVIPDVTKEEDESWMKLYKVNFYLFI